MYRNYENPNKIEELLKEAKKRFAEDPGNIDLHFEVEELEERLNFAWQDKEEG